MGVSNGWGGVEVVGEFSLFILGFGFFGIGVMVGCGVVGSVGNYVVCEVLFVVVGVIVFIVRTGSLLVVFK